MNISESEFCKRLAAIAERHEKRGPDDYSRHNYWLLTYDPMDCGPDEEGYWEDDEHFIRQWLEDRIYFGTRPQRMTLSLRGKKDLNACRYYSNPFIKMDPNYKYYKENEGYFYLRLGKKEWLIETDDVFITYDMIMKIQEEIVGGWESKNGLNKIPI